MPNENYENGWQEVRDGIIKIGQLIANAFSAYRDWYNRNATAIELYIQFFEELGVWHTAVETLAAHQVVFTGDISSELAREISHTNDVDTIVEQYYFDGETPRINEVIMRCEQSVLIKPYATLFSQIISAYSAGYYHLACIGLFSLADGVLSDFTEIPGTQYKKRIAAIEQKMDNKLELDDMDKKTLCIHQTITAFEESIFKDNYSFTNENTDLNRHWVMHGRSRRAYSRYDCLKILLWLDAIVFLSAKIEAKENSHAT